MNSLNPFYAPYGAYELKVAYQHNQVVANFATVSLVGVILFGYWLANREGDQTPVVFVPPQVIISTKELPPPPTITRRPPQTIIDQPRLANPVIGIPLPVEDTSFVDDSVVLATRDDIRALIDQNPIDGDTGRDFIVSIPPDGFDYIPSETEFVPVEIYPEMVHEVKPEYPRFAQEAGLEGVVFVKVLVMPDGSVRDAILFKSSEVASLDEAALRVAKQNVFKPGIQNGRAVAVWVVYRVEFGLTR